MRPRTKAILDFLDRRFIVTTVGVPVATGVIAGMAYLATKLPTVGEPLTDVLTFKVPMPVWVLLLLLLLVVVGVVVRWTVRWLGTTEHEKANRLSAPADVLVPDQA